jgi:hypothetical protein
VTTPRRGLEADISSDPTDEVWLDDTAWRARFGAIRSIEEVVEHLADHAIASLTRLRPTLM